MILYFTVGQMQHLQELGVEVKDTALCWVKKPRDRYGNLKEKAEWKIEMNPYFSAYLECAKIIPTLTLQEVLELLPKSINNEYSGEYTLCVDAGDRSCIAYEAQYDILCYYPLGDFTILEAAYGMLCWIAEHGYLNK